MVIICAIFFPIQESPCYSTYRNNTAVVSTMAGVLSAVTILIIIVLTAVTYVAIRRHRRRKMRAGMYLIYERYP